MIHNSRHSPIRVDLQKLLTLDPLLRVVTELEVDLVVFDVQELEEDGDLDGVGGEAGGGVEGDRFDAHCGSVGEAVVTLREGCQDSSRMVEGSEH